MSNVKIPSGSNYLRNRTNPKRKAEDAISAFKALLNDKTHPENQTTSFKNNEVKILNDLLVAANEMDSLNPGEGIFSLIVLCLRSSLMMKDKNLELQVKIRDLELQIKRLKKQ